jgi:antagonist of KipI
MSFHVLAPGLLTTAQDAGRHGHAALGVGSAGAMDDVSRRLANLLVGNDAGPAALEITLRGPRLRVEMPCLIALAGAAIDARCNGEALPLYCPIVLGAGVELAFGAVRDGARSYLAVAGGFGVTPALGSGSVDVNSGFGRALARGDTLAVGTAAPRAPSLWRALETGAAAFVAARWTLDPTPWRDDPRQPIALLRGAQFDALDGASRDALFTTAWRVAPDSNRVGYRLDGAKLSLAAPCELVSAGAVPGTLQLPPGGQPLLLMAEAPTTGGYPRLAHVAAIDLPRLGQRRPGDPLRFAEISLADAQTRYLARERALNALARNVAERLND